MRKFLKIAIVVVVLAFLVVGGAAFFVWRGVRQVPDFYRVARLTGEERTRAIESVERKVLNLQDDLDAAYARTYGQIAADATASAAPAAQEITVAFSGPELDTYFDKWLQSGGYGERFEKYMNNPRIAVHEGRLILAGEMNDFEAIVSLRFLPQITDSGRTSLSLEGVYAGRVPLPRSAFDGLRERATGALTENVGQYREAADISADGVSNSEAVMLATQLQLARLMRGEAVSELLIFPEILGRGRVPARVSEIAVEDGMLRLEVELLDSAARAALLEELKAGQTPGAELEEEAESEAEEEPA